MLEATKHYARQPIVGDGPLMPVILRLAGPVVLMMYLQGAYNVIDTIWVGQLLGKFALAGIATGGFVLWTLFGLSNLVAVGIGAKIARRMGEGNPLLAGDIAAKGLIYALALSGAIGLVMWFLVPDLFRLMGTGPLVTELGGRYLRVILLGCPLVLLSFTLHRIFQAAGDTMTPMWLMVFTLMVNTVLDPVLMLGMFGFPRLGVAGAALATVISRTCMVVLGIALLITKKRIETMRLSQPFLKYFPLRFPGLCDGRLRIALTNLGGWNWTLLGSVVRIGIPIAFSQSLFPVVYMVITRIPAAYSPKYVAALRIGHTVEGISFFLSLGFSIAAATCVGQNLGAGKPARAARSAWISSALVAGILFIFSILFWSFSYQIAAVFSSDPAPVEASAVYLKILAFSQIFMGLEIVLGGAFSGAGDTLPPMAILVPLNLARIPFSYLLTDYFGMGVNGVWWAISGTSIVKGILMALWFSRGGWKKKRL